MATVTMQDLLNAGAHFGHLTRRWNPKMKKYIFMERNGIYLIDLKKTITSLEAACNAVAEVVQKGEKVLFVGTKKLAQDVIRTHAERCNCPFVTERWLGGTLTNFGTIKKSIRHMRNLEKMETDGSFERLTKKEVLTLTRERDKMRKVLGGIMDMNRLPGIICVVDTKKDNIAVQESNRLGIPVVALLDTNCDPEPIDYPIPANDDAYKSISLITRVIADTVVENSVAAQEGASAGEEPETEKEKQKEEVS